MKTPCIATKYATFVTVLVTACVGCGDRRDSSTTESRLQSQPASEQTSDKPRETSGTADELVANSPHTAMAQIIDGPSETILAGTVSESRSVPWTKPDDIVLDATFLSKGNSFVEGPFAFADGGVRYIHIEDDLDRAKFRALFTIDGGEPYSFKGLYPQGYKFKSPSFETPQDQVRDAQARIEIMKDLKTIVLALHNYHNSHGFFPPATVYGPDGKPWHSWRVLILPQLGYPVLYEEYDFSVPWDAPRNASILKKIPQVYRHPSSESTDDTRTRYLVVSGQGTAFPLTAKK